jgi:calcineurin-like phosphoesterase family protein
MAVNDHMDCRGFDSVEAMNDYMVCQWNRKVRRNDEVVILGDFSWGDSRQTSDILDRLNGRLYLIKGNHDRFLADSRMAERFGWVRDYAELSDNKRKVVLCHYPIACYNGQYRRDAFGVSKTYMLHGHIHDTQDQMLLDAYQDYVRSQTHTAIGGAEETIPCQLINCFCKRSNYEPLSLDEWIAADERRRQGDA